MGRITSIEKKSGLYIKKANFGIVYIYIFLLLFCSFQRLMLFLS